MKTHLDFSVRVKEWLTAHETTCASSDEWGLVEVPVDFLVSPDPDIAARQKSESHVDELVESFQRYGIQVYNVKVLIWKHDVVKFSANIKGLDFKQFNWDGKAPFKMQVIAGDHTVGALKKLRRMRPNNKQWKTFKIRLVVCEDTKENRQMLLAVGSLDNKIAEVHRGATAWDNILQIHTVMLSIENDNSLNKEQKKKAMSEYREAAKTTMGEEGKKAERTIGNYFAIAKIRGKVWDNIAAIFKADAEGTLVKAGSGKKGKAKPFSYGAFCHMAYLPEQDLLRWTQRVLDGEWTPAQFKNRCLDVKKVLKMQDFIISYLNLRHQHHFKKFVDASLKYPFLSDKDYMNSLVPAFRPNKSTNSLPQTIANSIDAKIRELELQKSKERQIQVLFVIISIVVLSCFFLFTEKKQSTFVFFAVKTNILLRTTNIQATVTSNEKFESVWPGNGATIQLFHMDAKAMANKIPQQPYGTS